MVSTRASGTGVAGEENRMVVIVTGANSGFGLGICQQLLSNLSLPPGTPIPASTPHRSALPSSRQHLLDSEPRAEKNVPDSPPPTLTLILACRSKLKAEDARSILMAEHAKDLKKREERGLPIWEGWKEGLKIVWEGVDLDAVGGQNGILSFCERVKTTYPHITTMFLNAGTTAYTGNSYPRFALQFFTEGLTSTLTAPTYSKEQAGLTSSDGERGYVWGVNVLAPYIMAKELSPMLRKSPRTLPFPPRIIYTSSCTAHYKHLHPEPLDDYQLLKYGSSYDSSVYKASKYVGDIVMLQMDKELSEEVSNGQSDVRVLIADPGCVCTSIFDKGFGTFAIYREIMKFFYWLTFYMARLLGSTLHPVYAMEGALSMLYAALIDEKYIQPVENLPGQKFVVHSGRWGKTTVDCSEVDRWEEILEVGEGMVRACEAVRHEWRRREGLE